MARVRLAVAALAVVLCTAHNSASAQAAEGRAPGTVLSAIEAARSQGSVVENLKTLLPAASKLSGTDRVSASMALSHAFMWRTPPGEVLALARSAARDASSVADRVFFAEAFASWGLRDDARKLLVAAAFASGTPAEERVTLVNALARLGLKSEAGVALRDFLLKLPLPPSSPGEPLEGIYADHSQQLEPLIAMSGAGAAWDVLLDKAKADAKASVAQLVDRAIILDAAGLATEKAETLRLLAKTYKSGEAESLYASALLGAGDAWSAQATLMAAFGGKTPVSGNAHLDLLDSAIATGDAQAISTIAAADAIASLQAQEARALSEMTRATGDIAGSDKLFEIFIAGSGIDAQSRFNWEGSRLLANYYLDTGCLEMGRATAVTALRQFVEAQGARKLTRSSASDKFVDLFERFDGVDQLIEYCRTREKDFKDSVAIALLEEEALARLGRADEALAVAKRLNAHDTPQARDAALAAANARLGRPGEAVRLYKSVLDRDRQAPGDMYLTLADAYIKSGHPDDALKLLLGFAAGKSADLLTTADFFDRHGLGERAVLAYKALDDLSIDVNSKQFGLAVAALIEAGERASAVAMIERRVTAQSSFGDKAEYLAEALPRTSASAAACLEVATDLCKGPLAADVQLMSLFYRGISERAAAFLDARTAFAAARSAVALDGEDAGNLRQLSAVASKLPNEDEAHAALALYEKTRVPRALVDAIESELSTGATEKAVAHIKAALQAPLDISETAALLDVYSRHAMPAAILDATGATAREWWPWVLHARLADIALATGDRALADKEAGIVMNSGTYVGRALWAADFYRAAGRPEDASAAIERSRSAWDHPALRLAAIDVVAARGDPKDAEAIATQARQTYGRPPLLDLFRVRPAASPATPANYKAMEKAG